MQKIRVFADTNVILESFRTGCWAAISNHFSIETVEKCVEETLTGNPGDPRYVAVPPADLNAGLAAQYPVSRKEIASLVLNHPSCSTLDDGEQHLFAWLAASKLLPSQVVVVTMTLGMDWWGANFEAFRLGLLRSLTICMNLRARYFQLNCLVV